MTSQEIRNVHIPCIDFTAYPVSAGNLKTKYVTTMNRQYTRDELDSMCTMMHRMGFAVFINGTVYMRGQPFMIKNQHRIEYKPFVIEGVN